MSVAACLLADRAVLCLVGPRVLGRLTRDGAAPRLALFSCARKPSRRADVVATRPVATLGLRSNVICTRSDRGYRTSRCGANPYLLFTIVR